MKRFVPLLALLIIIGALLACGESDNAGTKASTNSSSSSGDTSKPAQHFKIGDTVNVGDTWQIVVSNPRTSPGGQFSTLKSGDVYVVFDVNFKNISKKEAQLFGSAGWTLKDTQGQKYDSSFSSDFPSAPDGKIEPGDPAKGSLVFEAPAGVKQFTLAYEDNMWAGGQTIWDISFS